MALPNSRAVVFFYFILSLILFTGLILFTANYVRTGKTAFDKFTSNKMMDKSSAYYSKASSKGMSTIESFFSSAPKIKVTYYTLNGCPHCTAFNPEWTAFEKMAKVEGIETVKYDARTDRAAVEKAGVDGFPTITITQDGTTTTYGGERKAAALMETVKAKK